MSGENKTMGYSEENGAVVIRLTRDDYTTLLMALGYATGGGLWTSTDQALAFLNRLNAGNPQYRPYETGKRDE